MKHVILIIFLGLILSFTLYSQTISGIVKDNLTGERLIGANIIEKKSSNGTISDNNGYFTLRINSPSQLQVSYIGYSLKVVEINFNTDSIIEVRLNPGYELEEVTVSSSSGNRLNPFKISTPELKSIPSLTGKPDLIKALQFYPGVMTQSEGSSLLLVRGGNPGENLYLLDNVKLLYVNHLGGFMSVFNPDAINNINFLKGSFPAKFGGKLSSIVEITQKEGNTNKISGNYSVGLTDISIALEGPVSKKTSFILTGRKTLSEFITMAASSMLEGNSFVMGYGFHDLTGKLTFRMNLKNSLHLSIYQGDDYLKYRTKKNLYNPGITSKFKTVWGNLMITTNWKHIYSKNLFAENIVSFSQYRLSEKQSFNYTSNGTSYNSYNRFLSSFNDLTVQSNWKYQPMKTVNIDFGLNSSRVSYIPNFQSTSTSKTSRTVSNHFETTLFIDNHITHKSLALNLGLRFTDYYAIKSNYKVLEPRISFLINPNSNNQVSLGFMNVHQFSHMLFVSGSIMANEIWIPADKFIKPGIANHYNLQWEMYLKQRLFQTEVSVYFKSLKNLVMYKEGYLNLRGINEWHSAIVDNGIGKAAGIELLIRKCKGTWTGFITYNFSNVTRQFELINKGKEFVFDYDRPHSATAVIQYKFSEKLTLNAAWVYQTGLPYTPAIGKQLSIGILDSENEPFYYETLIYGERNSKRMKDYHRLDLSLNYNKFTTDKKIKSTWTFSLYNAYNHQNPVYYYYNDSPSSEIINPETNPYNYNQTKMYQYTLFPIIPMVSYKRYLGVKNTK